MCERTDGLSQTALHGFDTGNECGGDGADAGDQNSELTLCRSDVDLILGWQDCELLLVNIGAGAGQEMWPAKVIESAKLLY